MRKICPQCGNLAEKDDRLCFYCSHPLVAIQEVNLEKSKDNIPTKKVEEDTLPNRIYRTIIEDVKVKFSKYFLSLYLPLGIYYLVMSTMFYLDNYGLNVVLDYPRILALLLSLVFISLNYIPIASEKKMMIAFFSTLVIVFLNYYQLNILDYIFLEKHIFFHYDLGIINLFFYSFLFFSFLTSIIKNNIFHTIFSFISFALLVLLFLYNKDLTIYKSLIYLLFKENNIYVFLFKISPLIISVYMIFVKRDIYFRVVLQFFLIIFILIQYYFFLSYLNYSYINMIFSILNLFWIFITIYLFVSLSYGIFLFLIKKD